MNQNHLKLVFLTLLLGAASVAAAFETQGPSRSREWTDRPWEIRYVLFVNDVQGIAGAARASREGNAKSIRQGREIVYLSAKEMFEPTATIDIPGKSIPLALVLIQFEKSGQVKTKSARLSAYTAKRSLLDYLILVRNSSNKEVPYDFATWSQGIPGDVSFSPAVCDVGDVSRYDNGWQDYADTGTFGCREWTAQLYQPDRPYIDVTSYAKVGSFVGEFIGWSRLTDPPKPVIGLQGKTWLCLHECPAGEVPGIIPSIKAWAAKHHFPMPQRPRKQPEFPNSDFRDDINE